MTTQPKILHIFNGDCACNIWKKQGGKSPYLVWRENYLEGPLPPLSVSNEEFERIRAEFLHCCLPELSTERLLRFLLNLDKTVASLSAGDVAVLWFDICMFDQVMLARILYLLRDTQAEVRLFCDDFVPRTAPEMYKRDIREARILPPEAIRLYTSAWCAVVGGANAVNEFNQKRPASTDPILAEAMLRYAEDHPVDGSPGRSERRLLQIIASGKDNTWPEIFHQFNVMEKHPFMGDTMCKRMLARLEKAGKVTVQQSANRKSWRIERKWNLL